MYDVDGFVWVFGEPSANFRQNNFHCMYMQELYHTLSSLSLSQMNKIYGETHHV